MNVHIERLTAELDQLATFSATPAPAVTRVLFTDTDLRARQYVRELAAEAGLAIREDPIGNIFFRLAGSDPSLPAVATGSHIDAIPHSGRYDGTVGVLGGLEALRAIQASGITSKRSLELIMFTAEEPTRFGIGCLGSRLLSGQMTSETARRLTDDSAITVEQARRDAGCQGELTEVQLPTDHYASFIELHIEQGPLLEQAEQAIGAVTAIAAPASLRVRYEGPGGHAGAVLMADRADPLLAAAALTIEVEAAALELGETDTVATVGVLDVHPRAVNSVPREVRLEIDVRDIDPARRDRVLERIIAGAEHFGDQRGVSTTVEVTNADLPTTCDGEIVAAIESSASVAQLSCRRMISRAYHDALFMAQICPTGMVFIPCRDGISHRPEEYASPQAIAAGVEVLARALVKLAEN